MTRGASTAMQTGEAWAPDEGATHAMNETVRGLGDTYTEITADMMRSSLNLMVQTQSLWLGSARHAAAALAGAWRLALGAWARAQWACEERRVR
ncbi:hypothetical protein AACH06_23890 [Ideonella sp. DXS29W]|uniref:Uncharacterized protein n=1 Tax=Ideonella lacteola TaxID=2984193 RepID=A0ABU9BV88_9BURK